MDKKPVYKTWIRTNKIIIFLLLSLVIIIGAICPFNIYLRALLAVCALPFIYITVVLTYSYYQFSSSGNNLQAKIHGLIVESLEWNGEGKLLDIGSGSASLIIKAAKAFPKSKLTGIDYWGENWEYSKKLCETNAEIEGVLNRIEFIKASASKLPFEDKEFDVLISCLTFHEVRDEPDKIKVLGEAFRVLKQGGKFVFMDLFMESKTFGGYNELQNEIKKLGVSEFKAIRLDEMMKLTGILKLKKVLGNAVVIVGKK